MDEMTMLENLRSEVPPSGPAGLGAEKERLMAALASPGRPARRTSLLLRRPAVLVAAAGGTALVLAGGTVVVQGGDPRPPGPQIVHMMPAGSVTVLRRAAEHAGRQPELHPRTGQFLVFESQVMNTSEDNVGGVHGRYLHRTRRKVWLPVEGTSVQGVIIEETLKPKPWPGESLPPWADDEPGVSGPSRLADFDRRPEFARTDYAYLSRLPADPQGMYRHLHTGLGDDAAAHRNAWSRVADMLREAYLPAAQRAALFRAAAAIPGVTTVGRAVDAAGREGVAAAMIVAALGVREEYIFDPKTYRYLGERAVVVDAAKAGAPVGSVLASSALLKVTVADTAPRPQED